MDDLHSKFHLNLHLKKILHDKYNDFLIAEIFKLLSLSMISLFIPIYLLKLGFSIFDIILFEIIAMICGVLINVLAFNYIIPSLNIKKSLILSYALYIIFYAILINSDYFLINFSNKYYYIALVTLFKIVPNSIYWMSHHLYFLKSTKRNNTGRKLGLLVALPTFIGIIAPFLGGVLITKASFVITFIVSGFFMLLASVSLMFSSDIKIKRHKINWKKVLDLKYKSKNKIFVIQGINDKACGFLWPVLLFLISIKILSMGFIYLLSNLIYSLTSYFSGKIMDKKGGYFFLRLGSVGHGFSLLLRAVVSSIMTITTVQSIGGMFGGIMHIALDGNFYKNSHKLPIESIINRELYLHIGRVFLLIILYMLASIIPFVMAFIIMIIFAGISTFMMGFLVRKDSFFSSFN